MPAATREARATLPLEGQPRPQVDAQLAALAARDRASLADVHLGRRFYGGDGPFEAAAHAYGLFAQSTRASLYPGLPGPASVAAMQQDVIDYALGLLQAPPDAAGLFTSGGTESVILATRAAVTRAHGRGLARHQMQIVAPISAHPCIHKAADLLNLRLVLVPTGTGFAADVAGMAQAITPQTVMLYGSFPSYAYGTADDIAALGALAAPRGLWLHVDACMSGLLAPFARLNGEVLPQFDFAVPGVTSISADLHKHGYAAKGASLALFRSAELARYASFSYADHPLPAMVTPTLAGTAPGAPIASAWAVMRYLGVAGYRDLARRLFAARRAVEAAVAGVPGFAVLGPPLFSIVVVTSAVHDLDRVRGVLTERGWFTLPVLRPAGIHLNLGPLDEPLAAVLARDLRDAAEHARV